MGNAAKLRMDARVAIADDDAHMLGLLAGALEGLGWLVTRADDGDQLLQALAEAGPFDLVVSDISMPWMTGLQVANSVRHAGLRTPLIMITALPLRNARIASLGPNTVLLRKPFTLRDLVAATRGLLGHE